MTREQYESLGVQDLREIAKARKMKGTSTLKKSALIDRMLQEDEKDSASGREQAEPAAEQQSAGQDSMAAQEQETVQAKSHPRKAGRTPSAGARSSHPSGKTTRAGKRNASAVQAKTAASSEQETAEVKTDGQAAAQTAEMKEPAQDQKEAVEAEGKTSDEKNTEPESVMQDNQRENFQENRPQENRPQSGPMSELDSGQIAYGILDVMDDGFGFIRSANYLPGNNDIYVAPSQIRRFGMKTGDMIEGNVRVRTQGEKFSALLYVRSINGFRPEEARRRCTFEDMIPVFPDEKITLEKPGGSISMRIMDMMCPVGKGQRGLIVSPPKAGKTTLMKEIARSITANQPDIHLIILLIDERPEEVTDMKEAIVGDNVEVIYSTFDETPEHHKRVSEMVIERAKRLVEHRRGVVILLDSITRLTRAYNLCETPSGRTLSGGLDPAALHMPKRFFGAARNMRGGGSLTILATALIDTGSKMDDVVYEEFKGTGNMEMVLDRKLSERRIFPAVDMQKSGTRRDDLLLTAEELESINTLRRAFNGMKSEESVDHVLELFTKTRNNAEFVQMVKKFRWTF